jgi:hypothetical protein|tara:strand:+ start:170 stop:751 length:582 start_codon:yes stop_codon:yes gene_type:complete
MAANGSTPSGLLLPNASVPEKRPQASSQQKLRGPDPLEAAVISRTVNDDSGNEKIDENASESEDDYEDDHHEEAPKENATATPKAATPKPVATVVAKEEAPDSEEYSEDEAHEENGPDIDEKKLAELKARIDASDQDENASFEELSDGDLKTHSSGGYDKEEAVQAKAVLKGENAASKSSLGREQKVASAEGK